MNLKPIRLITRKSPLAMAQTRLCAQRIEELHPGRTVEILPVVTTGDQKQKWSLTEQGGKGLFTRELENALLEGEVDLAVHSAKDLPTEMPEGLSIVAFLPRACPHDVYVSREGVEIPDTLASSSPRRRTQAKKLFPHAVWTDIRGNVETRLRKIVEGVADGTFLASAGLSRLNIQQWEGLHFEELAPRQMVPAAGQGAIALQCRTEDVNLWASLGDPETRKAVEVERLILEQLDGGCQVAIGVHYTSGTLFLFREDWGVVESAMDWDTLEERNQKVTRLLTDLTGKKDRNP